MTGWMRATPLFLGLLSVVVSPAAAQERAWLDVNFGVASASEDTYEDSVSFDFREETATGTVGYGLPSGALFDVGGGWMFHPRLGAGINIAGSAHEDVADVSLSIPHPAVFDSNAEDATTTEVELQRAEAAVNLQVMALVTPADAPFSVRVFGGPTWFRVRQDVVRDISYLEFYNPVTQAFSIDINGTEIVEESDGTGWGYNVGADVRYFFTDLVGVGGVLRFSGGEAEITGLFDEDANVDVGGLQIGGGLRLRF